MEMTIKSILTGEEKEVEINSREELENLMLDEWDVYIGESEVYYNVANDSFEVDEINTIFE